jgi:hypothetical protein
MIDILECRQLMDYFGELVYTFNVSRRVEVVIADRRGLKEIQSTLVIQHNSQEGKWMIHSLR